MGKQRSLRRFVPGGRWRRPMVRPLRVVCGEEPLGVDRGFVCLDISARQRRERNRATLAHGARFSAVEEDVTNPGLQGGAALEPAYSFEHPEPRLLSNLFGNRAI